MWVTVSSSFLMLTRIKTSILHQDVQFKPSLRAHPKNLFKFLTWKTNQNIIRDERWKCVLWKSAILFKLKARYYFCCLEDRLKSVQVKLPKHWYKQALKETCFLPWFSCLWYTQTIFHCKANNINLTQRQDYSSTATNCWVWGAMPPFTHSSDLFKKFFPAIFKCFRAHFPIGKVLLHTASKRFFPSNETPLQSLGAVANLIHFLSMCTHQF